MLPRYKLLRFWLAVISIIGTLSPVPGLRAETIKLNHTLPANTSIGAFSWHEASQSVIYPEQVNSTPGSVEPTLLVTLYRVGVDGSNPTPLTYPTTTDENGLPYQIPPGSEQLYYRGQKQSGGQYGLFRVPISGPISATIQLDKALPADWQLGVSYQISPDEKWVVYEAYYAPNSEITQVALYRVPADGPAADAVVLRTDVPAGDALGQWSITPDSQSVVYEIHPAGTIGTYTFYSLRLTEPAQAAVQLTPPVLSSGEYRISNDSKRLIYFVGTGQSSDELRSISSVPIAGPMTAAVQLSLTPTPAVQIGDYTLSSDSQTVIYSLYPQTNTVATLYQVPITGPATASVPLNSQALGNRFIYFAGLGRAIALTPAEQQIIYKASPTQFGTTDLYNVPLNGPISATIQLSTIGIPNGAVLTYTISKDSQWVVYTADQESDEVVELYRVPSSGPASSTVKLNKPLAPDYDVANFELTPDRQWIVYQTNYFSTTNSAAATQLFVVPLNGTAISNTLLVDATPRLDNLVVTADSRKVIYRSGPARAEEIYRTELPQPVSRERLYLPVAQR